MLTKHIELTEKIIGVFYEVYNALKFGFSEKIYENAFAIELRKRGFDVKQQVPIRVYYAGQIVGEYFADLLINDLVILELKAAENLNSQHETQLINYLRATKMEVGLLFNFGIKPEVRRKIFDNVRKTLLPEDKEINTSNLSDKTRADP